jgi:hypothetical protein
MIDFITLLCIVGLIAWYVKRGKTKLQVDKNDDKLYHRVKFLIQNYEINVHSIRFESETDLNGRVLETYTPKWGEYVIYRCGRVIVFNSNFWTREDITINEVDNPRTFHMCSEFFERVKEYSKSRDRDIISGVLRYLEVPGVSRRGVYSGVSFTHSFIIEDSGIRITLDSDVLGVDGIKYRLKNPKLLRRFQVAFENLSKSQDASHTERKTASYYGANVDSKKHKKYKDILEKIKLRESQLYNYEGAQRQQMENELDNYRRVARKMKEDNNFE